MFTSLYNNIFSTFNKQPDTIDNSYLTMSYNIPLIEDIETSQSTTNTSNNSLFKLYNKKTRSLDGANQERLFSHKSYKKKNKSLYGFQISKIFQINKRIKYKDYDTIKKYIKPNYKKYNYIDYKFYKHRLD